MLIRYLLATVCFALYLACSVSDLKAQRPVGVRWEVPDDYEQARGELELFRELGVTWLEVDQKLSAPLWDSIDEMGFQTIGALPIRFPLTHTFSEPDSVLLETITGMITHYTTRGSVKAVGLFQYGLTQDEDFAESLAPYVRQIREAFPVELYYMASRPAPAEADRLFDFKMVSVHPADPSTESRTPSPDQPDLFYHYNPGDEWSTYLSPVKGFLEETTSPQTPVFFDSQWLLRILEQHPEMHRTIKLFATDSQPVFPAPSEDMPSSSSHSPVVLLLILTWGVFAVNYSLSPVFRKSLSRYFIGHRFYVDDIMQRHIRSSNPALVMLLLHAILAGITVYSIVSVTFSDVGLEALSYYIPLTLAGDNFIISVITGAVAGTLALEAICILWLLLANVQMRQPAQAINLYSWPLHVNLYVTTAIVTFLMAGYSATTIVMLGALFVFIFFSAFIVTSIDTARYAKNKQLYLLCTSVLYLAVLGTLLFWILKGSHIIDVYRLALWLS